MMISPEYYYNAFLKGKSAREITGAIRSLKREINRLKSIAEHPEYLCMIHPSEEVRILCNKEYLERAKRALLDAGGEYVPTKAEVKTSRINANMLYICKVKFSICGKFSETETRIFTFDGDDVEEKVENSSGNLPSYLFDPDPDEPMLKSDFIERLTSLDLGEWRKKYTAQHFDSDFDDGANWHLKILFSNGSKPLDFSGSSAYPYNFEKLLEIINIDILRFKTLERSFLKE